MADNFVSNHSVTCQGCAAPVIEGKARCSHCGRLYTFEDYGSLALLGNQHLQIIKESLEKELTQQTDGYEYRQTLGLYYLHLGLYDESIEQFNKALHDSPRQSRPFFYKAVALLRGKKPKALTDSEFYEIESYLVAATKIHDDISLYYFFHALLKHDFQVAQSFTETAPTVEHLLEKGEEYFQTADELLALMKLIPFSKPDLLPAHLVTPPPKEKPKQSIDRKKIKAYFKGTYPFLYKFIFNFGLTLLVIGSALLFFEQPAGLLIFAGLLGFLSGAGLLYSYYRWLPTDQQILTWLHEEFTKGIETAQQHLTLEEDILSTQKFFNPAYPFETDFIERGYRYHKHSYIVNIYKFTYIFCTNYRLAAYQGVYNICTGEMLSQTTFEYPFADIVSLETDYRINYVDRFDKPKKYNTTTSRVIVSSGDKLTLTMTDDKWRQSLDLELPKAAMEKIMTAIRTSMKKFKQFNGETTSPNEPNDTNRSEEEVEELLD